jgi:DNA-binding GntR family transcriptional regulator
MMYPMTQKSIDLVAGTHSIARQSVPEAVAASLRNRILAGEFKDGEQLRQEVIASAYDVSRMPVREALRQLEAEGLVRLQTHKGAIVTTLSPKEVGELFDLRVMLEVDLLQRSIPRMTQVDFSTSEEVLGRLEAAYHSRAVSDWGGLNWQFHQSLYAPADRPQTMAIALNINNQTNRYVRLQLLLTGEFERAEREHRELLQLCRAGSHKQAGLFLKKHILDTKAELLHVMQQVPDVGSKPKTASLEKMTAT